MKSNQYTRLNLFRPADTLLPAALLAAALMGRRTVAGDVFLALYTVKLAALASSNGLRIAFARQPSLRYVQGSAILALALQLIGGIAAWFLLPMLRVHAPLKLLVATGLLLNIEHVFYEYLYALGDEYSATLCRAITALLALTGIMLCAPPERAAADPLAWNSLWPPATAGIAALVGLVVSLDMGRWPRPRFSAALLGALPLSVLQTALYPVLAFAALHWLKAPFCLPLLAGYALYEPCKSTFRRSHLEVLPFNIILTAVILAALLCGVFLHEQTEALMCCGTLTLAAICGLLLFGNLEL